MMKFIERPYSQREATWLEQSGVHPVLSKLFSSKAVVTVDADGKRRVVDVDERQQTNLSSLRDRYTKLQKSYYEQAGGAQSMAYQPFSFVCV